MATNTKITDASFVQSIRDNISNSLEGFLRDEYEDRKKELIAQMDTKFYAEVSAIALQLTSLCDFSMMQDRLIITVHKKEL